MVNNKINESLIPQVNSSSLKKKAPVAQGPSSQEFEQLLKQEISPAKKDVDLTISKHAQKRIDDRSLDFDQNEFLKIKDAITKLRDKGGKDSLIITNKAAYIVDVNNERIVTAMNKDDMSENVFTKIDSTLFIN
jgi:flagellar operon protein